MLAAPAVTCRMRIRQRFPARFGVAGRRGDRTDCLRVADPQLIFMVEMGPKLSRPMWLLASSVLPAGRDHW